MSGLASLQSGAVSAEAGAVRTRGGRAAPADAPGQRALSVWVRLLRVHGLMLRELRRRVPEHLTLPQFDVLVQLARRPEGMTPGELTRALLVTAGNVTGIVGRVVRGGLAERRPVPDDRRAVRIRLTARGRRLMRKAIPEHRRDVGELLARVSPADLARLRDLLGAVERGLENP
jgi:DNA-binding MarR family transcriptional regulator